jgi:hypothetical protein
MICACSVPKRMFQATTRIVCASTAGVLVKEPAAKAQGGLTGSPPFST